MQVTFNNKTVPNTKYKKPHYKYTLGQINFNARINLPHNLYFIKMNTYGVNDTWADKMITATRSIVSLIKNKISFEDILKKIENEVHNINTSIHLQGICINKYGIRKSKNQQTLFSLIDYEKSRGYEYYPRYQSKIVNSIFKPKTSSEYSRAITCEISKTENAIIIEYGLNNPFATNSNLDLIKSIYDKLCSTLHPTQQQVVQSAATIQWLIAQETPYLKGSDSIANLLTRSIMCRYGINISPLKKSTSCDFEAFYRNLDDYINIYPNLFENNLSLH